MTLECNTNRVGKLSNPRRKPDGYWISPTTKQPPKNPPTPQTAGHWVVVNAGWGFPPAFGFLAVETGLESEEPAQPNAPMGHYVSVRIPGAEHEFAFVWIPEIDRSFGLGSK